LRKERFADVDSALKRIGVSGLTMVEEKAKAARMWSYPLDNVKHVLVTVVVDDAGVRRVVESIRENATTASCGDGRIVVSSIDEVLDIGTKSVDASELVVPVLH